MSSLSKAALQNRLNSTNEKERLVITPILDPKVQIGLSSIDLRLGTRFLVDLRTREPYVSPGSARPAETFFDDTYRAFGEKFILYPGQLVLACTFEYVRLPYDLLGHVITRSSMNRLGLALHSSVQPGYTGTLTLELTNLSSNPIALTPGIRIVQLELVELKDMLEEGYLGQVTSKYIGNTGPRVSGAAADPELSRLEKLDSKYPSKL